MPQPLRTIVLDEPLRRRVMFAVEFLDPVTQLRVTTGLRPRAKGLAGPLLNPSGRFVWRLDDPPAKRQIHIDLDIENKMYGAPAQPLDFEIAGNDGTVAPLDLLKRFVLTTTPLYRPPPGMSAAAGRVLSGGGSDDPLEGIEVLLEVSHDKHTGTFTSKHVAVTDKKGEFVVALSGLEEQKLDPHATDRSALDAWLVLKNGNASVGRVPFPPLRRSRLTYLTVPVKWTPDPP